MAGKELINQTFDYGLISKDDKGKLISFEADLVKTHRRMNLEMLAFGKTLIQVNDMLANYSGGTWVAWLNARGITPKTAYRAMDAQRAFGSFDNCQNIELSAMYELAKADEAKAKAMKLADSGVKVTYSMAKQLIEQFQPEPIKTINHDTGEEGQTELDGTEPTEETSPSEPRIGTELAGEDDGQEFEEMDYDAPTKPPPAKVGEKCPNCLGTKWRDGACVKCNQPEGEPAGEVDSDRIKTQRAKTINTVDALMRALDDLQMLCPNSKHENSILTCKALREFVGGWK